MTEPESAAQRRDPVDVLIEECLAQYRRGDVEPIEEFVARRADDFPDDAARIRELLPELVPLEAELESAFTDGPTDPPMLARGDRIRHYRVERFIDRGGMGEVYLARNTKLGSDVAIKLLHAKFSDDPQLLAAFEREARMAAHLDHPNIAAVRDFFDVDGRHYLVMEFVRGQSLGGLLKEKKRLPLATLLDLAVEIAAGLAAAHERSIIHRDLKPENVMITPDGKVKILDFGLAKVDEAGTPASSRLGTSVFSSGAVLGTLDYMSPEQARGYPVDARTDIFSLGVVLYKTATGKAPFRRSTQADTISAILNDEPPSAPSLNPEVPAALGRLIGKLLAKRPEDRYQSIDAVRAHLEAIRAPPARGRGARSRLVLGTAAVLALAAGAVAIRLGRPDPPPAPVPGPEGRAFTEAVDRGDFAGALGLLRELETEDNRALTARALLEHKIREELDGWRGALEADLAAGRWKAADERIGRIEELDDARAGLGVLDEAVAAGPQAAALRREAAKLNDGVDVQRGAIDAHLESGRLDIAWAAITSLAGQRLEGLAFLPAADAAREMETSLTARLREEIGNPAADIDSLEKGVALLRKVRPEDPDLARHETRLAGLKRERALAGLASREREVLDGAAPGRLWEVRDPEALDVAAELKRVHEQMLAIDPDSESKHTRSAGALLARWRLAREAADRFADGSLATVPDGFAGAERGPVEEALAWRASYARARARVSQDPVAARRILKDRGLERELAPRFQDAATRLLGDLVVAIETAEAADRAQRLVARARDLVAAIVARARKHRFPTETQRTDLERLRSDATLAAMGSLFARADRALEELREHQAASRARELEYENVRKALRRPESAAGLDRKIRSLEAGWRRERRALARAIAHAPVDGLASADAELRSRRAVVSLRLREFADVLHDVEASGRGDTVEGLLLRGAARFGQGAIAEATQQFERAAAADERNARAHYWLGSVAPAADARRHLERAIALDPSLADAHYQLSLLYVQQGVREKEKHWFSKALASANRNLDSDAAFGEDEVVRVFRGELPTAARAKRARCDVYLVRAAAHFHLGRFDKCIDDCGLLLSIVPTLADAYYWRAHARHKAGGSSATVLEDLGHATRHAETGSDVMEWAQRLKKRIESGQ